MDKKRIIQFSAIGFIISAIGAAVGLGNIWWFPQRMVENGGSTFLIIYLVVLLVFALPVVLLELNYGLFFRKNVVSCFGKTFGGIGRSMGWMQVTIVAFLSIYYLVVLSWIAITFVVSSVPSFFSKWAQDSSWFDSTILKFGPFKDGITFAPWVFLACIVLILITFLILSGGISKGLEVANYIFVPGFFILLVGLTVYAVFFRSFGTVAIDVLFSFDFSKVGDPFVWHAAVKQVTFSIGILVGILVLFSSNSDPRMDKGNEAIIIIFADTFIALVAGLLVGGLIANKEGMLLQEKNGLSPTVGQVTEKVKEIFSKGKAAGGKLLFAYLPPLFLQMNGSATFGLGNALSICFILTLLFAGLSSLIALSEVFIEAFRKELGLKNSSSLLAWASLAVILVGFYSTSFGGTLVDNQDAIVLTFVLFLGFIQVCLFTFSPQYNRVVETNDQHTFLKLGPFHWFRVLLIVVVIPIMFIFAVFGVMNFFGLNYLLVKTDFFAKVKDKSSLLTTFYDKSIKTKFVLDTEQILSLSFFGFATGLSLCLTFATGKGNQLHPLPNNNQR